MTTVYFNFPEISLGNGIDSSKEITLGENRNTNIKVNDVNYTAYATYVVGKDNDSTSPMYFVVLCYSDANDRSSKSVYVVFPLAQTNPKTLSDIDNIIQGNKDVKVELNKYIKDNDGCFITDFTKSSITITLTKTQIPIKQVVGKDFYAQSNLSEMNVNRGNNTNAVLKKQDMDWVMTCDLLTEDGPTEKQQVDSTSTATNITMFFMVITISVFAYNGAPIIYKEFGLYNLAETVLNKNHYAISVYWLVALALLTLLCFIQSVLRNKSILLFLSMALMLFYFASIRGVLTLDGVHNVKGDSFKGDSASEVYSNIFFGAKSLIGRVVNIFIFISLLGIFSGLISTMVLKDVSSFVICVFLYILFSYLQLISIYYFNSI